MDETYIDNIINSVKNNKLIAKKDLEALVYSYVIAFGLDDFCSKILLDNIDNSYYTKKEECINISYDKITKKNSKALANEVNVILLHTCFHEIEHIIQYISLNFTDNNSFKDIMINHNLQLIDQKNPELYKIYQKYHSLFMIEHSANFEAGRNSLFFINEILKKLPNYHEVLYNMNRLLALYFSNSYQYIKGKVVCPLLTHVKIFTPHLLETIYAGKNYKLLTKDDIVSGVNCFYNVEQGLPVKEELPKYFVRLRNSECKTKNIYDDLKRFS